MRILTVIFVVSIAILFSGCSSNDTSSATMFLPNYTGASGNVIVVMPERHWTSHSGAVIKNDLGAPCPQFLSREPQFDVDGYDPSSFSPLLKKFRNIIVVDISNTQKNSVPSTELKKDVWAQGQLVAHIHAKDSSDFIAHFRNQSEDIKNAFALKDMDRYAKTNRKTKGDVNTDQLQKKFGIDLDLPSDYVHSRENDRQLWYKRDQMIYLSGNAYQVINNVVISVTPFDSDSMFTEKSIVERANRDTGAIILSVNDDNFRIEPKFPVQVTEVNFKNNYGVQCRGLWKFENPLMGGPYSSLTVHDPSKNRIITVEGFMFGPKFDKREYMREMEAILYSLNF